jgi:hypothetical protein
MLELRELLDEWHAWEIRDVYGYRPYEDTEWDRRFRTFLHGRGRGRTPRGPSPGAAAGRECVLARQVSEARKVAEKRLHATVAKAARRAALALPRDRVATLKTPEGRRYSELERLRRPPTRTTGTAFARALERVDEIGAFQLGRLRLSQIPPNRLAALAREHGLSRGAVRTAIADLMPEHTAAAADEDAPAPELPSPSTCRARLPTSSVPPSWSPTSGPRSTMPFRLQPDHDRSRRQRLYRCFPRPVFAAFAGPASTTAMASRLSTAAATVRRWAGNQAGRTEQNPRRWVTLPSPLPSDTDQLGADACRACPLWTPGAG